MIVCFCIGLVTGFVLGVVGLAVLSMNKMKEE